MGGYCSYCVIFKSTTQGHLGALVKSPLVKFKKALDLLSSHATTDYHKSACAMCDAFLEVMSGRKRYWSAIE